MNCQVLAQGWCGRIIVRPAPLRGPEYALTRTVLSLAELQTLVLCFSSRAELSAFRISSPCGDFCSERAAQVVRHKNNTPKLSPRTICKCIRLCVWARGWWPGPGITDRKCSQRLFPHAPLIEHAFAFSHRCTRAWKCASVGRFYP